MTRDQYQPTLREAIDACRPDSEDLRLPEMQELARRIEQDAATRRLYDRSQRLDAAIGRALHDVPIPDGLAAQLLEAAGVKAQPTRVGASHPSGAPEQRLAPEPAAEKAGAGRPAKSVRWASGRTIWIGGAVAACLCLVVFSALRLLAPPAPTPVEPLVQDVLKLADQLAQGNWNRDLHARPIGGYPTSLPIRAVPRRWRRVDSRFDPHAVAYELGSRGSHRRVYLIVIRTNQQFAVGATLPAQPHSTTGGLAIGVCQQGRQLFVLVVKGDARRYRDVLSPASPLA